MNATDVLILVAVSILVAVNVYFALSEKRSTISSRITHYSGRYPMIPFALGVLVGHWLW